jgi:hypothetical protein
MVARFDVVHFEETCPPAARGLAAVLVSRQHFPTDAWGNGGGGATAVFADRGVAAYSFGFGFAQLALACIGLDCHSSRCRVFVDVDLDWGLAGENPPGGPFMYHLMRFCGCIGFVRNFHLPDFQKRCHRLKHELRSVCGHTPPFVQPFKKRRPPRFLLRAKIHNKAHG